METIQAFFIELEKTASPKLSQYSVAQITDISSVSSVRSGNHNTIELMFPATNELLTFQLERADERKLLQMFGRDKKKWVGNQLKFATTQKTKPNGEIINLRFFY